VRIDRQLTDRAVLEEIGRRIARARLERNMGQSELSAQAGVGVATVQRLERGHSVAFTSLIRVLRVLGLLETLDRAIPEGLPSPLEQLRLRGRQRQRAGHSRSAAEPTDHSVPWRWGDRQGDES
jgi:transcriptional regulator with XRE-family HTH domain